MRELRAWDSIHESSDDRGYQGHTPTDEEILAQPCVVAALAAAGEKVLRALPYEVRLLLTVYRSPTGWDAWECAECGGEYPKDIVTACPRCSPAARTILDAAVSS